MSNSMRKRKRTSKENHSSESPRHERDRRRTRERKRMENIYNELLNYWTSRSGGKSLSKDAESLLRFDSVLRFGDDKLNTRGLYIGDFNPFDPKLKLYYEIYTRHNPKKTVTIKNGKFVRPKIDIFRVISELERHNNNPYSSYNHLSDLAKKYMQIDMFLRSPNIFYKAGFSLGDIQNDPNFNRYSKAFIEYQEDKEIEKILETKAREYPEGSPFLEEIDEEDEDMIDAGDLIKELGIGERETESSTVPYHTPIFEIPHFGYIDENNFQAVIRIVQLCKITSRTISVLDRILAYFLYSVPANYDSPMRVAACAIYQTIYMRNDESLLDWFLRENKMIEEKKGIIRLCRGGKIDKPMDYLSNCGDYFKAKDFAFYTIYDPKISMCDYVDKNHISDLMNTRENIALYYKEDKIDENIADDIISSIKTGINIENEKQYIPPPPKRVEYQREKKRIKREISPRNEEEEIDYSIFSHPALSYKDKPNDYGSQGRIVFPNLHNYERVDLTPTLRNENLPATIYEEEGKYLPYGDASQGLTPTLRDESLPYGDASQGLTPTLRDESQILSQEI